MTTRTMTSEHWRCCQSCISDWSTCCQGWEDILTLSWCSAVQCLDHHSRKTFPWTTNNNSLIRKQFCKEIKAAPEHQEYQIWGRMRNRWWQCCWWAWDWRGESEPPAWDREHGWSLGEVWELGSVWTLATSGRVCHSCLQRSEFRCLEASGSVYLRTLWWQHQWERWWRVFHPVCSSYQRSNCCYQWWSHEPPPSSSSHKWRRWWTLCCRCWGLFSQLTCSIQL